MRIGFIMELHSIQYQNNIIHPKTNKSGMQYAAQTGQEQSIWGSDGFSFGDVIDIVNPLQHLPVISKYYREMTGDDCSEGSKTIGDLGFGALFGGVLGVAGAVGNSALRHETNKDMSEHIIDIADEASHPIKPMMAREEDNPFFAQAINGPNESYIASTEKIILAKQSYQNREEMNPFFAQLFEQDTAEYSSTQVTKAKSGKDWGSV